MFEIFYVQKPVGHWVTTVRQIAVNVVKNKNWENMFKAKFLAWQQIGQYRHLVITIVQREVDGRSRKIKFSFDLRCKTIIHIYISHHFIRLIS